MSIKLLIIDPQNDFCDIAAAALPIPGASADLMRLADFVDQADDALEGITVTLDSHPTVAIERVTFWRRNSGEPVAPFTVITSELVQSGSVVPRDGDALVQVSAYLQQLESQGRYQLIAWPVHCVLGTPGHNIFDPLAQRIAAWEVRRQRQVAMVLKGMNPLTEHYSAIRAEVPRDDDPATGWNQALVARLRPTPAEHLLVAGEASSHCVQATVLHLFETFSASERSRTVLLTDCMSPVPGFESNAQDFFTAIRAAGGNLATCATALATFGRIA